MTQPETADSFRIHAGPTRGSAMLLRLEGRLDARAVPGLLEQARAVLTGGSHLVLNLSTINFIGSSGVGALLVLVEQFQEKALEVRLSELSPAADSVIRLLNLHRHLPTDANDEAAFLALQD